MKAQSLLEIQTLGTVSIRLDGQPVTTLVSRKAEGLLVYLACHQRPFPREQLADLLWDERTPARALANLRVLLTSLRKQLAPYLHINRESIGFNHDSHYQLDITELANQLQEADKAILLIQQIHCLETAVSLNTGLFLDGFHLRNSRGFEAWQLQQQTRWQQHHTDALQSLIAYCHQHNDYPSGIRYATQLLQIDPLHETAQRQLMQLLAHNGQRQAAITQYEAYRQQLAETHQTTPDAETEQLHQRLLATPAALSHNLPAQATSFVGRQRELAQINQLLENPTCRLLTLVGPGGSGKTRLALEAASRYVKEGVGLKTAVFPDGIFFIQLAPLDNTATILPALAEALHYTFHEESSLQQQLLDYLQQKQVLLLLDNFDHMLSQISFIDSLLRAAPQLKIVATSRTRLRLHSEHLLHITGMETPSPSDDATLTTHHYSAIQLFIQSAQQVQAGFTLTAENTAAIITICQLVEGLPLAIILAATWIELLSPQAIAQEIRQSLDFLATDMADIPPRQRSIRAVFDYTWALLSPREQTFFCQLSVFRGSFDREAAQTITTASLRELLALVNKSLVYPTPNGRYTVHELLRQYALEKLDEQPDLKTAVFTRHSHFYTSLLQKCEPRLQGAQQQVALSAIETDGENVRLAWQWACQQQDATTLHQAAISLGYFYAWRGRYDEGLLAFGQAAKITTLPALTLAKLKAWQAEFARHLGQMDNAKKHLQTALTLLEQPNANTAEKQSIQAFAYLQAGDNQRETDRQTAQESYRQSLALYRQLADPWGMANALTALGWLVQHLGAYQEAKTLYEESLTIRQELGDQWGLAHSLISLGRIWLYLGNHETAETLIRRSIPIRQTLGDQIGLARSLNTLGETLTWQGKFSAAKESLREGKQIFEELGLHTAAFFSVAMLGLAELHLGQQQMAQANAQMSLAYFRRISSRRGMGYASLVLGWALLADHHIEEAKSHLLTSLEIYRAIGQPDELGQALALLGYCAYQQGDFTDARSFLVEAMETAVSIQAFMPLMIALPVQACLFDHANKQTAATRLRRAVASYPLIIHSCWFADLVGRVVAGDDAGTLTAVASNLLKTLDVRTE